jgi:hypothetical protein
VIRNAQTKPAVSDRTQVYCRQALASDGNVIELRTTKSILVS